MKFEFTNNHSAVKRRKRVNKKTNDNNVTFGLKNKTNDIKIHNHIDINIPKTKQNIFLNYKNNILEEFMICCLQILKYLRHIEIPDIKKINKYETVLIEYRILPHLECLIRNMIIKLGGKEWSHTIICGNNNYDFMKNMCNNISPNINVINTNYDNINHSLYSEILTSEWFWHLLNGEKILIYQHDTCLFKNNISDFLEYDYIGAPWTEGQNDTKSRVGNGGFSLRTRNVMIDVIKTISLENTQFNSSTISYVESTKSHIFPEDVYFAKNIEDYNLGKIANAHVGSRFSTESILNIDSLGGHNFWINDKNWKNRVKNIIVQFKRNSPSFGKIEHRGGFATLLEELTKCNFYNDNSRYDFYDMADLTIDSIIKSSNKNRKWSGIFHLTPITPKYLDFISIDLIFKNKKFIKALDNCLFIITLSPYLTKCLNNILVNLNKKINIYTLKHPVLSENIPLFDITSYETNKNKYIIQLGQQLRKMTSIYALNVENHKKIWLTGSTSFDRINDLLNLEIKEYHIKINKKTVEMTYTKTFEEYDEYLRQNVVFIHLFDAAANNALLECLVRNTPVIINKLEGVVDYLGENYPLYFDQLSDVNSLLSIEKIKEASEYLRSLDKSSLTFDSFKNNFLTTIHREFNK